MNHSNLFSFLEKKSQPEFDNSTFNGNMFMYDNDVIIDPVSVRLIY